jgi:hypothetical protein
MDRRNFLASLALAAALPRAPWSTLSTTRRLAAGPACGPASGSGVRTCAAQIEGTLDISLQANPEWAFPVCIAGIFRQQGHPITPARLVDETWGKIGKMPRRPASIVADLNRSWLDDDDRAFSAATTIFTPDVTTAARELGENRPVLLANGTHAMVLDSLTWLEDPLGRARFASATAADPLAPGRHTLTEADYKGIALAATIRVA